MAKANDQRKKAVVDARVQYTLALRVVLHFSIFIVAGAFFGVINQFLADPFAGVSENLWKFWSNSGPIMLALVCLMPVFVRDTLTLSNRVAGPVHNMRNTIRKLADGETDVRPLKFRKGYFWDDIPDLFNRMTETLRNNSSTTAEEQSEAPSKVTDSRELMEV